MNIINFPKKKKQIDETPFGFEMVNDDIFYFGYFDKQQTIKPEVIYLNEQSKIHRDKQ